MERLYSPDYIGPTQLTDIDPPRLLRRTPTAILAKVSTVDFLVVDVSQDNKPVLGIELKTGKSHIGRHGVGSRIAEFQLDTSDCDDILTVLDKERIPVYLAHAQVIDRAEPPTVRYAALGIWWTDLFAMEACLRRVQTRPRETRQAAYYDASIFREFETFAHHITAGDLAQTASG